MNMFKYAEEFDEDYYDPEKCIIYKVKEYNRRKKLGQGNPSIEIANLEGIIVGHLYKNQ